MTWFAHVHLVICLSCFLLVVLYPSLETYSGGNSFFKLPRFAWTARSFLSIMWVVNVFSSRLERKGAPGTPEEEKALNQDLRQKAMSLHTPKVQHIVHQNEVMQMPKTSCNYSHPSKAFATLTRNVTKPFHWELGSGPAAMSLLHGTTTLGRWHHGYPINLYQCWGRPGAWRRRWPMIRWKGMEEILEMPRRADGMCLLDKGEVALQSSGAVTNSLMQNFPQESLLSWSCRHKGAQQGSWHPQIKPISDHS